MKKNFLKTILLLSFFCLISCSKDSVSQSNPSSCPQGYNGYNCSTQITPVKITISKIEIISFPETDTNSTSGYWDYNILDSSQNSPDLAILLSDNTTSTLLTDTTNNPFLNASILETHSYIYNNFNISNVNDLFKIELRDIDSNNNYETMDVFYFGIYNALNNFPPIIYLVNGETKYKIYVTYTW